MENVLNTLRPAWQFQLALSTDYTSPSSLVTNNSNSCLSQLLLSGKNFAACNAWEKVPAMSAKQVLNLSFSPIISKKIFGRWFVAGLQTSSPVLQTGGILDSLLCRVSDVHWDRSSVPRDA